jgi:hypothetical protein
MMRGGARYAIALLLPAIALIASFVRAPYFSTVHVSAASTLTAGAPVHELYRHQACRFAFTTQDLLAFDRERPRNDGIGAVLFDVYPGEAGPPTNAKLTWIRQIASAVRGAGDEGTAQRFESEIIGRTYAVGEAFAFQMPMESPFVGRSGTRLFIALAVRHSRVTPVTDQHFTDALLRAIRIASDDGVKTVGIPFLNPPAIMKTGQDRHGAWKLLLQTAHTSACAPSGGRVIFGGYGLLPESREENLRAFESAWSDWRASLQRTSHATNHDRLRTSLVALIAALLTSLGRKRELTVPRFLAMVVAGGIIGVAVIDGLSQWLVPLLPAELAQRFIGVAQLLVAALAGALMEHWVRFDWKKQIAAT